MAVLCAIYVCHVVGDFQDLLAEDVVPQQFTEALKTYFVVLAVFYAPWCGYCTTLHQELIKAAAELDKEGLDVRIVTVDATEELELASSEGVDGYPTIAVYRNGERTGTYRGERTNRAIAQYLREKAGPVAFYVPNQEAYASHTRSIAAMASVDTDPGMASIVFGLFPRNESSEEGGGVNGRSADTFLRVASRQEHLQYMMSDVPEVINTYGMKDDGIAIITYGRDTSDFTGQTNRDSVDPSEPHLLATFSMTDMSTAALESRILSYTLPVMFVFGDATRHIIDELPVREHVLLFVNEGALIDEATRERQGARRTRDNTAPPLPPASDGDRELNEVTSRKLLKEAKDLADEYRGRLLFVVVPSSEHAVLQHFDLEPKDLPQVTIVDMRESKSAAPPLRYSMKAGHISGIYGGGFDIVTDRSTDGKLKAAKPATQLVEPQFLGRFLDQYVGGELQPSIRTEPPEHSTLTDTSVAKRDSSGVDSESESDSYRSVHTIVGMQVRALVMEAKTHVLLLLVAPWCGHCKSVEPVVADVADAYRRDSDVTFYRMDATRNDLPHHPDVQLVGYPTIYLFPLGGKPVVFDGVRTTTELVRFISRRTGVSPRDAVTRQRPASAADEL